jgi:hypothetical protein
MFTSCPSCLDSGKPHRFCQIGDFRVDFHLIVDAWENGVVSKVSTFGF